MQNGTPFDQALEAVERLPADEQADLLEVIRHRLAERGRQRIATDAREAREEHASGKTKRTSVDELMGGVK